MRKSNQFLQLNQKGVLRCARYAFMPNKLSFCGPDKNKDLFGYCTNQQADKGLNLILRDFQVMYPYLRLIAYSAGLKDIFDERVVESYWIGGLYLEKIKKNKFYWHLLEEQQLKKKLNRKLLRNVIDKIPLGAKPHHSFHVFNVWKRTGNFDVYHTIRTMDLCKISWGKVIEIGNSFLRVQYNPLIFNEDKLALGALVNHQINYKINDVGFIENLQIGDWVSFHWNFACEKITSAQVANLEKYTKESIRIANF